MGATDLREAARRHNRMIALHAALQCWARDLDVAYLSRETLDEIAGERGACLNRRKWLLEDLKEHFPYQQSVVWNGGELAGMFIGRIDQSARFPQGAMSTDDGLAGLSNAGLNAGELTFDFDVSEPQEVHRILAPVLNGFAPVTSLIEDLDLEGEEGISD